MDVKLLDFLGMVNCLKVFAIQLCFSYSMQSLSP